MFKYLFFYFLCFVFVFCLVFVRLPNIESVAARVRAYNVQRLMHVFFCLFVLVERSLKQIENNNLVVSLFTLHKVGEELEGLFAARGWLGTGELIAVVEDGSHNAVLEGNKKKQKQKFLFRK